MIAVKEINLLNINYFILVIYGILPYPLYFFFLRLQDPPGGFLFLKCFKFQTSRMSQNLCTQHNVSKFSLYTEPILRDKL